jgi:hypothetical protein
MRRMGEIAAPSSRAVVGWGLGITALFMAVLGRVLASGSYEFLGGLIVAPVLVALSLPILAREAERKRDRRLMWLLCGALGLKLLGAVARYYMVFDLYNGGGDSAAYHLAGVSLSQSFISGSFIVDHASLPMLSGNLIGVVTGIVYMIIGPTGVGGFLVFSWLAFWGMFFFYRAADLALPETSSPGYGRLLFFLPSMIFWPSSIGKEAWMVFTLGLVAFGGALALSGKTWRGLGLAGGGMWLAGMARPHVAGIAAVALAAGYLLRRSRRELGELAPVIKAVSLVGVVVIAALLVDRAESFLTQSRISTESGVEDALQETARRTNQGGSGFDPPIVRSPLGVPLATFTVLFRPLVIEADSALQILAAAESSLLLLLILVRRRQVLAALTSVRRQPYVGLALAFVGLFVLAFSGIGNFGILARQRVQALPFLLVLLAPQRKDPDVAQLARP